ncbi:MAG: hypothetical protein CMK49_02760 [Prochlorococcus sp. SP3034]|nr:hypothetical protein [Prochlorococcus sp. SP3034]|tara:strand:- start:21110 stop:21391 length:282 start_codon:yes stop_codon:yes gene_type:complete
MKKSKLLFLAITSYVIVNLIMSDKSHSDVNTNSLIKMFCLENVKYEISKANLKFDDEFAKSVCNCYIENISNNKSHENSISECKKESKNKFNL